MSNTGRGGIPLLFIAFIYCLTGAAGELSAQRTFGVIWEVPESETKLENELELFKKAGISILEIDQLPEAEFWNKIDTMNFRVFLQIPVYYPIVQTYAKPDSALIETYRDYLANSLQYPQVSAIGMFAYGQTDRPGFAEAIESLLSQIRSSTEQPIYYKTHLSTAMADYSLFNFRIKNFSIDKKFIAAGDSLLIRSEWILFNPAASVQNDISLFKDFLSLTKHVTEIPIFVNDDWLFDSYRDYPKIVEILSDYSINNNAVFPLPANQVAPDTAESPSRPWMIIILLVAWGAIAATYNFEPTYRKSLFRFFTGHKFFVEDVMNRQIRPVLPGLVIVLQHALLGGLFLASLSVAAFTTEGLKAFYHHYPWIGWLGEGYRGIFRFGLLITIAAEIISMLWIYFLNTKTTHFTQVLTLYSWPLQLNLPVVTVMLALLMAGTLSGLIIIFCIIFPFIMIATFISTALDTGKYLRKHAFWYHLGTIGLYSIILCGIFIWVATNSYLLNVLRLAAGFP